MTEAIAALERGGAVHYKRHALAFLRVRAAVDVPVQLWESHKKLLMTKQEVRDEHKDQEGRPEVKQRIRQVQREMSQRRMMSAIPDADVIITLRLQNERMSGALLPSSQEYFKSFGLTPEKLRLAKPDAIVMHPGPINRGVEIDSAVVDGKQSVILPQVTFGIAVRMAVMSIVAGNEA